MTKLHLFGDIVGVVGCLEINRLLCDKTDKATSGVQDDRKEDFEVENHLGMWIVTPLRGLQKIAQ